MIAHLRGRLIAKHPNQAIVEAAGVGYDVTITVPTFSDLPALGSEVALHVHTHVREDTIALYGFLRAEEKQLFEKLITVSGIGPEAGNHHPQRHGDRGDGGCDPQQRLHAADGKSLASDARPPSACASSCATSWKASVRPNR